MASRVRLAVVVSLLAGGVAAPATAQTGAYIYDRSINGFRCNVSDPSTVASAVGCSPQAMDGGTASAYATGLRSTRTASALSNALQSDPSVRMNGIVDAYGYAYGSLNIIGTPSSTDQLVFHLTGTHSESITGASGASASIVSQLGVIAFNGYGYVTDYLYSNGATYTSYSGGAQAVTGGLDVNVGSFFGFTGLWTYYHFALAGIYVNGDGAQGLGVMTSRSGTLLGIDAVDANGNLIASATFDGAGNGTLDLNAAVAAPEPAGIVLMGTGLIAIFSLRRRRAR